MIPMYKDGMTASVARDQVALFEADCWSKFKPYLEAPEPEKEPEKEPKVPEGSNGSADDPENTEEELDSDGKPIVDESTGIPKRRFKTIIKKG